MRNSSGLFLAAILTGCILDSLSGFLLSVLALSLVYAQDQSERLTEAFPAFVKAQVAKIGITGASGGLAARITRQFHPLWAAGIVGGLSVIFSLASFWMDTHTGLPDYPTARVALILVRLPVALLCGWLVVSVPRWRRQQVAYVRRHTENETGDNE